MQSVAKKTYYKRRYYRRFRRYRKISDQVFRFKVDWGSFVCWPNQSSGNIGYDRRSGNSSIIFQAIISESVEFSDQINAFTQYFSKCQLYGILMEIIPLKENNSDVGPVAYSGFILGKNSGNVNIDTVRAMNNALPMPSYGSPAVRKYFRIKGEPWLDVSDQLNGVFFVISNKAGLRADHPQWEVKYSLYIRYRYNIL